MRLSRFATATTTLALAVGLAACGSSGGGSVGTKGAPPKAAPSSEAPAAMPGDVAPSSAPPSAAPSAPASSAPASSAPPSAPASSATAEPALVWGGDAATFGTTVLELLKKAAVASGIKLSDMKIATLAKDGTLKCGNAEWKGSDPTIPIFVWCKSTGAVVVVIPAVQAALAAKGFDYAVAIVFDFSQAVMYFTTAGVEKPAMQGCIFGATLKVLVTFPGNGLDVGSDLASRGVSIQEGVFRQGADNGLANGGANCF